MQIHGLQMPAHQVYGFASLVAPGLGHFLQRMPFRGALWLMGALTLWFLLYMSLLAGIDGGGTPYALVAILVALYHCVSMYTAMARSYQAQRDLVPAIAVQEMMPVYLWKQVLGGALAVVGAIAVVVWSGALADYASAWLTRHAHGGWWHRPAWGQFLSQTILLWGMTALGGWLFWTGRKEREGALQAIRERAVVAHALQHGGRITVAEASMIAQIPLHEARTLLERLVLERHAIESEQNGIVYYHLTS